MKPESALSVAKIKIESMNTLSTQHRVVGAIDGIFRSNVIAQKRFRICRKIDTLGGLPSDATTPRARKRATSAPPEHYPSD
jgi:hypothetical protein